MSSLRTRLFLILVATTGAIWLAAIGWIYLGTKGQLERVLDTRLQEAARMVSSLVRDDGASAQTAIAATPQTSATAVEGYERQLSCQIWSLGGRLVAASTTAPPTRLSEHDSGFRDSVINGELWRVYAVEDMAKGVRVLVGDRLGLRDRLVQDLVFWLVAPALLMLPLFAGLIWLSVGRGLSPLRRIASDLQGRAVDDLQPVRAAEMVEVRPVTEALNSLFGRLEAARRHEREVTAFAAHELRTPLAGIRTQAQIAKAADSDEMRISALNKIVRGVDRTARLVSQLLALARLDAGMANGRSEDIAVGSLLREIAADPVRTDLAVEIDPALDRFRVTCDQDVLRLALRNLHQNAADHSPAGGGVFWRRIDDRSFAVEDEGPGIDADELPLVRQRFYRGRRSTTAGSGLGLAIVDVAIAQIGGVLHLERSDRHGGLRAVVRMAVATP